MRHSVERPAYTYTVATGRGLAVAHFASTSPPPEGTGLPVPVDIRGLPGNFAGGAGPASSPKSLSFRKPVGSLPNSWISPMSSVPTPLNLLSRSMAC